MDTSAIFGRGHWILTLTLFIFISRPPERGSCVFKDVSHGHIVHFEPFAIYCNAVSETAIIVAFARAFPISEKLYQVHQRHVGYAARVVLRVVPVARIMVVKGRLEILEHLGVLFAPVRGRFQPGGLSVENWLLGRYQFGAIVMDGTLDDLCLEREKYLLHAADMLQRVIGAVIWWLFLLRHNGPQSINVMAAHETSS
jgi:hypothetical protein